MIVDVKNNDIDETFKKMQDKSDKKLNETNCKIFLCSYVKIKDVLKGQNVRVDCVVDEKLGYFGYISIIGDNIMFKDHKKIFTEVIAAASNVEMFPHTDGTVEIAFAYHDLDMEEE